MESKFDKLIEAYMANPKRGSDFGMVGKGKASRLRILRGLGEPTAARHMCPRCKFGNLDNAE